MSAYLPILVGILVTMAIWYLLGSILARQRVTRWAYLVAGLLTRLGEEESFRWLGWSGAEFRLTKLGRPFVSLIAVIWVVPPWYAPARLLAWVRGQQTVLGIAADMSVPPLVEFVLADPSTRVGQRALAQAAARGWPRQPIPFGDRTFALASPDTRAAQHVARALDRTRKQMPSELLRIAVQTNAPNLSISLGHPERLPAARPPFYRWLQTVATLISRG